MERLLARENADDDEPEPQPEPEAPALPRTASRAATREEADQARRSLRRLVPARPKEDEVRPAVTSRVDGRVILDESDLSIQPSVGRPPSTVQAPIDVGGLKQDLQSASPEQRIRLLELLQSSAGIQELVKAGLLKCRPTAIR